MYSSFFLCSINCQYKKDFLANGPIDLSVGKGQHNTFEKHVLWVTYVPVAVQTFYGVQNEIQVVQLQRQS